MVELVFKAKSTEHRTTVKDLKVYPDCIVRDQFQPENEVSSTGGVAEKVTKMPKSRVKIGPNLPDPPATGLKVGHLPAEKGEIKISDEKIHENIVTGAQHYEVNSDPPP